MEMLSRPTCMLLLALLNTIPFNAARDAHDSAVIGLLRRTVVEERTSIVVAGDRSVCLLCFTWRGAMLMTAARCWHGRWLHGSCAQWQLERPERRCGWMLGCGERGPGHRSYAGVITGDLASSAHIA